MHVEQEILRERLSVGEALEDTAHEAGVSQVLQPCQSAVVVLLHHINQLVAHSSPLFLLDLLLVSIHLLKLLVLATTLIVKAGAFARRRAGEGRLISLICRYFDLEHEDLIISYIH